MNICIISPPQVLAIVHVFTVVVILALLMIPCTYVRMYNITCLIVLGDKK